MGEKVIAFVKYRYETVNYGTMNTVHRKVLFFAFWSILKRNRKVDRLTL